MVPHSVCDERRASWIDEAGGFDADAFQTALNKGTALVVWAQATMLFFYATGVAVAVRVLTGGNAP